MSLKQCKIKKVILRNNVAELFWKEIKFKNLIPEPKMGIKKLVFNMFLHYIRSIDPSYPPSQSKQTLKNLLIYLDRNLESESFTEYTILISIIKTKRKLHNETTIKKRQDRKSQAIKYFTIKCIFTATTVMLNRMSPIMINSNNVV